MKASHYIDLIAPEHSRTSCSDDAIHNATYSADDPMGGCFRCTLMTAQISADEKAECNEYSFNKMHPEADEE